MARRGLTGQLNMFDFFRELETNIPQDGELEMVSLMPSFEEDEISVSSVEHESVEESMVEVEEKIRTEVMPSIVMEHKTENKWIENENENKKVNKKSSKTEIGKKSVSHIQEIENSKEPEENPLPSVGLDNPHERPVMQRTYTTKQGIVEIAYMNYSKVRVCEPGKEAQIKEFASSKEAVDYYVEQMQKLEELYTRDN